ncbi:COP9 signalosome complex subunit 1 [Rhododendron vialii]|uniref:COP9 signalosome complex subunit 1 n=1 Tax=Rhododendron vialii TaxID=182163 RepID=UPI00265F224F|nr:COP9 signalosome complex subunit 1 [Rhododendron vialii]
MDGDDEVSAQMIDEIYANGGDIDSQQPHRPVIINGEQLDVEAYAALYTGRTKIRRLMFIADHCDNNVAMQLEALRMAYDEVKKGENTQLFREVVNKIDGRLGQGYGPDPGWSEAVERRAEQRKEKLENELNAYRTNLIKESIRMGYNDFGDFYYAHGALGDAFKNYVRTRDYCTTSKHIIHMCLNAILVSIEMGQFTHVSSYVGKAEQSPDALDAITVAKLRAAGGLALLEAKKYKLAARKFLETGHELGNSYSEVIAPQDIATYGGLCALASFDRAELKSKVIDNLNFRNFLELVPEVRELIHDFYSSHYASCLDYLGNLKANLLLDIHLHDHVETLYNDIRHKALIQYTHPFVSVDLRMMANAFKTSVPGLEKELEALITDNQIQARIDSHNKILYARHADQRNATFQRALQTGGEFDQDVRSMLLRASLIKHDYNLKSSRKF